MKALVNGAPQELREGTTVSALVAERVPSARGVAVAVNGEVVPRSRWDDTRVLEGDRVEVLGAKGGG